MTASTAPRQHQLALVSIGVVVALAACAPLPTPENQGGISFSLTELDVGGLESRATTISPDAGFVAGVVLEIRDAEEVLSIFVYETGTANIDYIRPIDGLLAWPEAVNDQGDVVGYGTISAGVDFPTVPVASIDGELVQLAGSGELTFGAATAFTVDGRIVGYLGDADESTTQPVMWVDAVPQLLGSLGGDYGQALDITSDGEVVGWSQVSREPFVSSGFVAKSTVGAATVISGLGGETTFVRDVSANGVVLGDGADANGSTSAFTWTADGGITVVATPFGDGSYVLAKAIDVDGRIVGFGPFDADGEDIRAWTVRDGGTAVLIDDLLNEPEWVVRFASDIAQGVIAADAERDGVVRAVIVTAARAT